MVGVVQRTRDVDFVIDIPFWVRGFREPSQLICEQLRCRIYYDPASDDCLLVNESDGHIHLTRLAPVGDDVFEILLAPTATRPRDALGAGAINRSNAAAAPSLGTFTATPGRQISRQGITPLLSLLDGDVAIVRTTRPKTETSGASPPEPSQQATHVSSPVTYELRRVKGIPKTVSSSVFVGQHSELSDRIVAKVIRYEGMASSDLVRCARKWQLEKEILEKLRHRSIVALKAFDSRLFAVYIERLPLSLDRGLNSPFQPSDVSIILRDISSAFAYLETQGIAHNDIKPANITYSRQRGAVLIDFEMARFTNGDQSSGGTPWYLPPEFAISQKNRGAPGDVWALGVTMLYVLRKVGLPERAVGSWRIHAVADKNREARRQMTAWINSVT